MLVCSCAAVANHIPACVCFWTPDARLGLGAICVCFYACFYALDACVFVYFWAFCVFLGAICVCARAIFVCFCAFLCARACAFGAAQGVRCGRWGLKGSLLRNLGNHSLSQSALSLCASSLPALSRSLARALVLASLIPLHCTPCLKPSSMAPSPQIVQHGRGAQSWREHWLRE